MSEPSEVTATASVIRSQKLVKCYGKREVVRGVDLSIRSGEVVGLLGPNGAGKTTTFYMITGLIAPSAGSITLDDQIITRMPMFRRARLGIGYLPQEPSVFSKLTVRENILAILETLKLTSTERKQRLQSHLEDIGLTHLANQRAYTLSGGERRRLEITRALVTRPKFLLMDEPFSGVDPINVAEVQKIIANLRSRGIGVLITDHNVRETLSIVDRAYLLYDGNILAEGSKDFLINDPDTRRHYLGENFKM
ncbi:MAG: LPS export ABC transporter ATP-binding protein [Puniceicoccaceae bacterium]